MYANPVVNKLKYHNELEAKILFLLYTGGYHPDAKGF
jgi:hypothetical protein